MIEGYFGIVIDNDDNERRGRLKVRVYGKMDSLEFDMIPYSQPDFFYMNGNFVLPKIGELVFVYYIGNDYYHPIWRGLPIPNKELIEYIGDDYKSCISMYYDSSLKVGSLMIPSKGILNFFKDSSILIRNDETILLKSKERTIHINNGISLGQENKSNSPSVLGDVNEDVLNDIVSLLSDIKDMLFSLGTKQTIQANANFILANLVPEYSEIVRKTILLNPKIELLKSKIPKTKSKIVSLD